MSCLSVYVLDYPTQPLKILTHAEDIRSTLAPVGVDFIRERCEKLAPNASATEMIAVQQNAIKALKGTFALTQVERLQSHDSAIAAKTNSLYYCIEGRLLVCIEHAQTLYVIECNRHDAVLVPKHSVHWLKPDSQCMGLTLSEECRQLSVAESAWQAQIPDFL